LIAAFIFGLMPGATVIAFPETKANPAADAMAWNSLSSRIAVFAEAENTYEAEERKMNAMTCPASGKDSVMCSPALSSVLSTAACTAAESDVDCLSDLDSLPELDDSDGGHIFSSPATGFEGILSFKESSIALEKEEDSPRHRWCRVSQRIAVALAALSDSESDGEALEDDFPSLRLVPLRVLSHSDLSSPPNHEGDRPGANRL